MKSTSFCRPAPLTTFSNVRVPYPNFPLPPKRSVTFSPPQLRTFIYLLISTPAAASCAAPLSPEPDSVARPAMSLITWATGTSGSDCQRPSAVNEGDYIGGEKALNCAQ